MAFFGFCSSSSSPSLSRCIFVVIAVAAVTGLSLKLIGTNIIKSFIFQQVDVPLSLAPEVIAECEQNHGSKSPEIEVCSTIDVATKAEAFSDINIVNPSNDVEDKINDEISETQQVEEVTMTQPGNERFFVEKSRVEGYFCRNGQESDSTVGQDGPIRQGQAVKICIRPVQNNLDNFVRMKRIVSFTWTRHQDNHFSTNDNEQQQQQVAVENGVAAPNGLTEVFCTSGYAICYVETVLLASFFASSTNIIGYGVVELQFSGEESTTSVSPRHKRQQSIALQPDLDSTVATAPVATTASFDIILRVQLTNRRWWIINFIIRSIMFWFYWSKCKNQCSSFNNIIFLFPPSYYRLSLHIIFM